MCGMCVCGMCVCGMCVCGRDVESRTRGFLPVFRGFSHKREMKLRSPSECLGFGSAGEGAGYKRCKYI